MRNDEMPVIAASGAAVTRSSGTDAPPRPILVVLHQQHSNPGHIGQTLVRHGHVLDVRRPRFGDSLPLTLAEHDGLVIFGGPMSANDPDDYIRRETNFIGVALKEEKPFLGVCLGAQMLARLLGTMVFEDPDGSVEIGYHNVRARPEAAGLFGGGLPVWPSRFYQWHKEGFELPPGATLIAENDSAFPNQAFSVGRTAIGIQFHPEITYAMVSRWSGHNPSRLTASGAQAREAQLADHLAHGPAVRRWLDLFLRRWVAEGRIGAL